MSGRIGSMVDRLLAFLAPARHSPAPRPLDLRGFRMTRREAASWLDAIDPPALDDSHPTRGDLALVASREEFLLWAQTGRLDPRARALCAIYLAAARGELWFRPAMCVHGCGRPATLVPYWEDDFTPAYCDTCGVPGEDIEVPWADHVRALWTLKQAGTTAKSNVSPGDSQ
jgi:hypothetical protein